MSDDSVASFSTMLRQALGDALVPGADTFVAMFADDGVMEFPFVPDGLTKLLEGRQAVAAHLESLGGNIVFDKMELQKRHQTIVPGDYVLEFMGFGRNVATGEPYEQTYISVIEVRGGYITSYRDYWNPLVLLKTLGADADATPIVGNTDG